jgi:hypothetical protein
MSNVIYLNDVRARLGKGTSLPRRRARAGRGKGGNPASIGELSRELLELLRE